MPTFRFRSDTAQQHCKFDLMDRGIPFEEGSCTLTFDESVLKDDRLMAGDSWQDIEAVSVRSNPPEELRDQSPQQVIANITTTIARPKPPKSVQRRKTRGQP